MRAATGHCFRRFAANDNQTPAWRALKAPGEHLLERLLGLAGALRFGLLLAGI
jgi:hypothetical protein